LWLAPEQVRILPVSDPQLDYAKQVVAQMRSQGIRAEADTSGERLAKMIRNAEKQKIPVMSVVGAKEVESNTLNIRTRASGELGEMTVATVIEKLVAANRDRANF
jgi:threonyl-tRNA synthetase